MPEPTKHFHLRLYDAAGKLFSEEEIEGFEDTMSPTAKGDQRPSIPVLVTEGGVYTPLRAEWEAIP